MNYDTKIKPAVALLGGVLLLATACSKQYDDTPLRERVDKIETSLGSVESRIAGYNKDLEALRQIANALKARNEVTNVKEQLDARGRISAYIISFAKGSDVTINMGQDGRDAVPQKIVLVDGEDGHLYWGTSSGRLRDASGNYYRADGNTGVTPRLKIEGDEWYVSYDEGRTWTSLGRAKGSEGESSPGETMFESVDYKTSPYSVAIRLKNNAVYTLPRRAELNISFDVGNDFMVSPFVSYTIPFTITGDTEGLRLYVAEAFSDSYQLYYTEGERNGHVKIMVHDRRDPKLILAAVRQGKTHLFFCKLSHGVMEVKQAVNRVSGLLDSKFEVPVRTNYEYRVHLADEDKSWLSVSDLRAVMRDETLRFTAKANDKPYGRVAEVQLQDNYGNVLQTIHVYQTAAEDKSCMVEVTISDGTSFSEAFTQIRDASWDGKGGYYAINEHLHRLKIKGVPSESDWQTIFYLFKLCRIIDLSESGIKVIPANTFDNRGTWLAGFRSAGTELEYIIFPPGLERIEENAFTFCDNLTDVSIPSTAVVAPGAFRNSPVNSKIKR